MLNFLTSYEYFIVLKLRNSRAISPAENGLKFLDGKCVSAPQKLSDFIKEMVWKNNDFSCKNMKNT